MSTIRCYDKDGSIIDELYQWDENVKVKISDIDISNVSQLHFCNRKSETALVVTATVSNGSITANIPNVLLRQPESIIIFICEALSGGETRTTHVCRVAIHPRPKADNQIYVEEESGDMPTLGGGTGSGGSDTTLDGAVMYNGVQTLSDEQKAIARGNIGALSESEVIELIGAHAGSGDSNGGSNSGDMMASVYDPQGRAVDIFEYVDQRTNGSTGSTEGSTSEPAIIGVKVSNESDGTVRVIFSLDNFNASINTFTLDEHSRPINVNIDGTDIPIEWPEVVEETEG